jgi:hypothetical protein
MQLSEKGIKVYCDADTLHVSIPYCSQVRLWPAWIPRLLTVLPGRFTVILIRTLRRSGNSCHVWAENFHRAWIFGSLRRWDRSRSSAERGR